MDERTHLIERAAARLGGFGIAGLDVPAAVRRLGAVNPAVIAPQPPAANTETETAPKKRIGIDALAEAGLISSSDALYDRVTEEFRIIESKVLRQAFGGETTGGSPNLLMITSSVGGEGTTFCSLNLAGEVARQGDRKVLLIDIDPKSEALAGRLGVRGEIGLLDLARGTNQSVEMLTIPSDLENLDFLPFGTNGQGSAELFASQRMADVISDIGRRNPERLVIFDAPPALASSTPHTLAAIVGQVIFVVAAGQTQETDIEAGLDLLQACPHISLLLNKVPTWLAHSFGSYAPTTKN